MHVKTNFMDHAPSPPPDTEIMERGSLNEKVGFREIPDTKMYPFLILDILLVQYGS